MRTTKLNFDTEAALRNIYVCRTEIFSTKQGRQVGKFKIKITNLPKLFPQRQTAETQMQSR